MSRFEIQQSGGTDAKAMPPAGEPFDGDVELND